MLFSPCPQSFLPAPRPTPGLSASVLSLVAAAIIHCGCIPAHAKPPHLAPHGTSTQLIVEDKSFLVIGGQVHNSSSSDPEYFDRVVTKLVQLNANTVLAPVTWELLEPIEGTYDFTQLEHMVGTARKHQLKLIVLWFGSWKNGVSQYAPTWVRRDTVRFPRAHDAKGQPMSALSTFGHASREADKTAFTAMMKHLRKIDEKENTVIMVQVENEAGLFESRDHCPDANSAFSDQVPQTLIAHLIANKGRLTPHLEELWQRNGCKERGSWTEVFGATKDGDEIFMAWRYATYIGDIAASGKAAYDLPFYVNAWLAGTGQPGEFPSGGPVHRVIDVWKAAAPAISICAPDIYANNFKEVAASYHRADNPLFIPETHADVWYKPSAVDLHQAARNVFWAVAHHDAICFAPFGLEGQAVDGPIAKGLKLISDLSPVILEFQGTGRMDGFLQTEEPKSAAQPLEGVKETSGLQSSCDITLNGYVAHVIYSNASPDDRAYGLIINTAPDEFLIAGDGLVVYFSSATQRKTGLAEVWEQVFTHGKWVNGRRLNGDQTNQGSAVQIPFWRWDNFDSASGPRVVKVKLFTYD
jgi:beta-galactosidase GanA